MSNGHTMWGKKPGRSGSDAGIFFPMAERKRRVVLFSVVGCSALGVSQAPVLTMLTLLVHPAE